MIVATSSWPCPGRPCAAWLAGKPLQTEVRVVPVGSPAALPMDHNTGLVGKPSSHATRRLDPSLYAKLTSPTSAATGSSSGTALVEGGVLVPQQSQPQQVPMTLPWMLDLGHTDDVLCLALCRTDREQLIATGGYDGRIVLVRAHARRECGVEK